MDHILIEQRNSFFIDLDAALDRILRQLPTRPEVHKVILFGSFARGQHDLHVGQGVYRKDYGVTSWLPHLRYYLWHFP